MKSILRGGWRPWLMVVGVAAGLLLNGCNGNPSAKPSGPVKNLVRVGGSSIMVDTANAWAQAFKLVAPEVTVEVSGNGTEDGISGLMQGTFDIANASRELSAAEVAQLTQTGKRPTRYVVDYEALALYVHKDNPLNEITLDQVAEVYSQTGTLTNWSQLGVLVSKCEHNRIVLLNRNSTSASCEFFREYVLKTNLFKPGTMELNSSANMIATLAQTPCALGYAATDFATPEVKALKVAARKGQAAYAPSVENILNATYPFAQRQSCYTLGELRPEAKKFLDFCLARSSQTNLLKGPTTP